MTKIPENDLEWYLESYKNADNYSFWQYALIGSDPHMLVNFKEPLYGMVVWILHYVLGGDILLFKFSLSLINYLLLTSSVVCFSKAFKSIPLWLVVTGIYLMCFLPWIFTMSLQLLRQFLACSLFYFVLIRVCFFKKKDYCLIIAMVLIHSTAWFFLPFLLIPAFDNSFRQSKLWYIIVILGVLFVQILAYVATKINFLNSLPVISYALSRASHDTEFELEELSLVKFLMLFAIIAYSIYLPYRSVHKKNIGIRRFGFTMTILCLFIIINKNQVELANRFFFYTFPVVPFYLMLLFREIKIDYKLVKIFTLLVMVFFTVFLKIGTWKYMVSVWTTPVFLY